MKFAVHSGRGLGLLRCILASGFVLAAAQVSTGQTLDEAIVAYNSDRYLEAAVQFAVIAQVDDRLGDRYRAEYYVAQSLFRAGFLFPAYTFYRKVFEQGSTHPHFLDATDGLLQLAEALDDDLLVPEIISRGYDQEFENLSADRLNTVNYMVGLVSRRVGNNAEAEEFLRSVNIDAYEYPKALYYLGVMAAEETGENGGKRYEQALKYLQTMAKHVEGDSGEDVERWHRLAQLGQARIYYAMGAYEKSIELYKLVPRYSEEWMDALFESGWAYRMRSLNRSSKKGFESDIGRTLGMMHSVQSPYFFGRFRAESHVLKATAYFDLCRYARAKEVLDGFFTQYEPMVEAVEAFLQTTRTDELWVQMWDEGAVDFPHEVRRRLISNHRLGRLSHQLFRIRSEAKRLANGLPPGRLKEQLAESLADQEAKWVRLMGRLVRTQIQTIQAFLRGFISQARAIQFETTDAELKKLEGAQGSVTQSIPHQVRTPAYKRGQPFWRFNGEYWRDELGYYRYAVTSLCP